MKRKKRAFTLLEIMISILIITLITGAIGYNMRGTLEKGRAFRTEQGKQQLYDLLQICAAEAGGVQALPTVSENAVEYLKKIGLAKDPDKLVLDGWGKKFDIKVVNNDFEITSQALDNYQTSQK